MKFKLVEEVQLDKDGNFISSIEPDFKRGNTYQLYDFDFKEVTPDMYSVIEEQSFANTDEFKNAYTVSWWDGENLVAIVSDFDDANGDRWLSYLEVTEKYRGHGLSSQLLDFAIKDLGCTYLGVSKKNEVAISVYEKAGFVNLGEHPDNPNQYMMRLKK